MHKSENEIWRTGRSLTKGDGTAFFFLPPFASKRQEKTALGRAKFNCSILYRSVHIAKMRPRLIAVHKDKSAA